jgi:DNA polymerase III delta prime subunit
MVSFIIIANEKSKREAYTKDFAEKQKIDPFDITTVEKDTSAKPPSQSIGIEVVKQIQKKVFLKPIKSKSKLLIIEDAQLLTIEAQNALLKVLEEPPANTLIILGTETKEALLPTIQSRCQIILLEEEQKKLSEKTLTELNNFIESIPQLSVGEKLKHAEQLAKDKDKAIEWIANLIIVLREKLLETVILGSEAQIESEKNVTPDSDRGSIKNDKILNTKALGTIKKLQSLHTLLKTTNVNPRFAIEHTLLSL